MRTRREMLGLAAGFAVFIAMPLIAACVGSREAEQPAKPATATLAVEGMT